MSERPLHTPALSPEEHRLVDACMDATLQGDDAARAEELTRTNPAFSAELEAQRSMIASLRAPSGRIDVTASVLDAIPGLGEHRRKALVTHFGSVARLKEAGVDELTAVPGIGAATAQAVVDALRSDSQPEPGAAPTVIGNDRTEQ